MDSILDATHYQSLSAVRTHIDELDREIVELLAHRWRLSMIAIRFKVHEPHFQDDERRREVLEERDDWGIAAGLPRQVMKRLYNYLIDQVEDEQARIRSASLDEG